MDETKCPKCNANAKIWHDRDTISDDDDYTCTCFKCTNCGFIFDWVTENEPTCEYYNLLKEAE